MAKRGMAMSATTKANIGAGRKTGLSLSGGGLGTSPFSQSSSLASKSVRKVNSEIKSKLAKRKKKGLMNMGKPQVNNNSKASPLQRKPIGKFAVAENYDATPSTPLTPQQKSLREIDKAKNRVEKRLKNYSSSSDLLYFSSDQKDPNWRRNLSLSLKRFWADKKAKAGSKDQIAKDDLELTKRNANSFFRRGNPRLTGQFNEYRSGIKGLMKGDFSIFTNPRVTGKTKMELLGAAVGTIEGKARNIKTRVVDRVKDFNRGRATGYTGQVVEETFEKYNLGKTSAIGGGATLLALGTRKSLKGKARIALGLAGTVSLGAGAIKGGLDRQKGAKTRKRW